MAAGNAPAMPVPLLALPWYTSTPLPDAQQSAINEEPAELTELSQRLLGAFETALHCDLELCSGDGDAVLAHRVVLRRNPAFRAENLLSASERALPRLWLPEAVKGANLRAVLRAHYAESVRPQEHAEKRARLRALEPEASLKDLRSALGLEERAALECVFGSLDGGHWTSLAAAVDTLDHSDCELQLSGSGARQKAHRAIVCGAKDGHYFTAACRWPGASVAEPAVMLPQGLSREAMLALMQLRYGKAAVDLEHILEMRHYAELFDWTFAREACETQLEAVLRDAEGLDGESLLAVLAHTEESKAVPLRLKAAALAAAVRQWGKVSGAAADVLQADRCLELRALNRIRNRDGHVCDNLKEYMDAAVDDLTEWERGLSLDAPLAVRKQLERSWMHWVQLLFEFGRLHGVQAAETWRERIQHKRDEMRQERAQKQLTRLGLAPGRLWFEASWDWREVPAGAVCGQGLEYRCDMQTGRNFARLSM